MKYTSVSLPIGLIKMIDEFVERRIFASRSEAVRLSILFTYTFLRNGLPPWLDELRPKCPRCGAPMTQSKWYFKCPNGHAFRLKQVPSKAVEDEL